CYSRTLARVVPGSSAVEQPAVNRLVAGSNPARGAIVSFPLRHSIPRVYPHNSHSIARALTLTIQMAMPPFCGETGVKKSGSQKSKSPSQLIDAKVKELGDWRGKMLSRLRTLVKEADPDIVEEWKWRGVPVWSHEGLICTGETYKSVVKMTFAKGAALKDPSGLFNASLDGNVRRAIDFRECDKINEKALKTLIRAAVTLNKSRAQS